jgi:YjbE family integral membrane protein
VTEAASWLLLLLQLFLVDLVLGADNALVIGFACRGLSPGDARRAAFLGATGAIALRLGMVLFADALLAAPFVKLVAAWILIAVALNVKTRKSANPSSPGALAATADFATAAVVIVAADAAMSLDNVVALASIANGNYWALAIGVLMSIPIIVYGALIVTRIMDRVPELLLLGAAFLGWVAGGMAVSDPLVAGWVATYAPALPFLAPGLFAGFVLLAGGAGKPGKAHAVGSSLPPARSPAPQPAMAFVAVSLDAPDTAASAPPSAEPIPPRPSAPASLSVLTAQRPPRLEAAARSPSFQAPPPSAPTRPFLGLTEEQLLIAGLVLLAGLAGLMLAVATYFDSLL